MIDNILSIISSVGTVAKTGRDVVGLIKDVKDLLSKQPIKEESFNAKQHIQMNSFQSQIDDPYNGGAQWVDSLHSITSQSGNSWIPKQTRGFAGIDLTGIWGTPSNPYDQTYIRQYGPYLNIIAGICGTPTVYAEGIFNPQNGAIEFTGINFEGMQVTAQLTLLPQWTIKGTMSVQTLFNIPIHAQIDIIKYS